MRRGFWILILLFGAAYSAALPFLVDFITKREELMLLDSFTIWLVVILIFVGMLFAIGATYWAVVRQKEEIKKEREKASKETSSKFENKIVESANRLLEAGIKKMGISGDVRAAIYTNRLKESELSIQCEYNIGTADDRKFSYGLDEPIVGTIWSKKKFTPLVIDVFEKKPLKTFFISEDKFRIIKNKGVHTILYIGIPNHNRQEILGVLVIDSTLPPQKSNLFAKSMQKSVVELAVQIGMLLELGQKQ